MKILHTADWHLGQSFYERDRLEEQRKFLDFLLEQIDSRQIDLLIIAGDIFDTANPPRAAEQVYYDFITRLYQLKFCKAIIIGGNHDSAPHLDAPSSVLSNLNAHVVGSLPETIDEAIFNFERHGKRVRIAAIPFLRDRDVRRAVERESFDEMEARTKAGIIQNYRAFADRCIETHLPNEVLIATGHLTAVGGKLSESERSIHIGNLGSISADQFPAEFDYIALGHLHQPQTVGNHTHIRYSGSPIPLSFSESPNKEMRLLTIEDDYSLSQEPIPIPLNRRLLRMKGSADAIMLQIEKLIVGPNELAPWIEVTVTQGDVSPTINDQIREAAAAQKAVVLKVSRQLPPQEKGALPAEMSKAISEWKPQAVFQKRIENYQGDIPTETLMQCYTQVLHAVQEDNEQ
jgi:exonuclease SbcD